MIRIGVCENGGGGEWFRFVCLNRVVVKKIVLSNEGNAVFLD